MSADSGPVARREVAYRLFAAEYDDADLDHSDSEEERAPNYVVTPTGARINRLFVVGVLTEVEPVSDDVLRARVVDPTGAFVVYAGQYQPEAVAFLEAADVPSFVAVTGKARTFQPEGSDRIFTSVRPESMTAVDAETRDRWTVQAAEHTLARIATMAAALDRDERGDELTGVLRSSGVEPGLAAGVALAIDHYGPTPGYLSALRGLALAAAAVVTGDRDEVESLDLAPGDAGPVEADPTAAPAVAGTLTGEREMADRPAATAAAEPSADDRPADATDDGEAIEAVSEPASTDDDATDAPASAVDVSAEPDDLGDFDATADTASPGSDPEVDDEPYDLDDAEREAVESEYGTEFSTGSEVGAPGEAGIEPETEPPSIDDEAGVDGASAAAEEPVTESGVDTDAGEPSDGIDLEETAVEAMGDIDDGDGADRDAVVAAVVDVSGADADAVEAAIDDALMSGRCYEPADGRLKAI